MVCPFYIKPYIMDKLCKSSLDYGDDLDLKCLGTRRMCK